MRGDKIRAIRKTGRGRGRARRPLLESLEARQLLATYTVNATSEYIYPQPYPATPDPSLAMGLGDAINFSNRHAGVDRIVFAIDSGPQTIFLGSALPSITDPVTIDGTTQPGFSSPPIIGITPANASTTNVDGLNIQASNTVIKSLAIFGFTNADGIKISAANKVTIQGSNIGIDQSNSSSANKNGIEVVSGQNNLIGGSSDLNLYESNTISGNSRYGILLDPNSSKTTITGNFIGTNPSGTLAIPNYAGIYADSSSNNFIGSDKPYMGNVISGNSQYGVWLDLGSNNNVVQGNMIGVSGDASTKISNYIGIFDLYNNTGTIGGSTSGAGNVIGGNRADGLYLINLNNYVIQGNYIGTDPTGLIDLGNNFSGILESGSSGIQIGGTLAGAGNVIAFNGGGAFGGNLLGNGITLQSSNDRNIAILGNSIYSNAVLGIDLGGDGPTPNDNNVSDSDTGANGLQNYPVITKASTILGRSQVSGTFNSTPNTSFRLEFFASPPPPPSNPTAVVEGKSLLGYLDVTTDNSGNAPFNVILAKGTTVGYLISGTATTKPLANGSTSEFSPGVPVEVGTVADLSVTLTDNPDPATASTDISGFGLSLLDWGDGSSVPTTGNSMVYVGLDTSGLLQIRIFDSSGVMVTDTNETKLPAAKAAQIATLKQQIPSLMPPHVLTATETTQVLYEVSAIVESYVTYTATVVNSGSADATNVILTETLTGVALPNTTFDTTSLTASQGTISISQGQIVANLGAIPVGGSATVTVRVLPTVAGTISASASVAGGEIDVNTANNSADESTSVLSPADLSLQIDPPKTQAIAGQKVAFVVLVTNKGPDQAKNVALDLTLPDNSVATFEGAFPSQGTVSTPSGNTVHVDLGTLARGITTAIRVVLTPLNSGPLSLTGTLSFPQIDPDNSNNTATITTQVVNDSDLAVTLKPDQTAALSNQNLSYRALVGNMGPYAADNVIVTFQLPANSTFLSATSIPAAVGSAVLSPDGQTVTLNIGHLNAGAQAEVDLQVEATSSGAFVVSASAASDSGDTVPGNNTSSATIQIDPVDLQVVQSTLPTTAEIGQNLTYSLSVQNTGLAQATNVTVYDQLPDSVTYVSGSVAGGTVTYDSTTHKVTISIPSIAAGSSVPVSLIVVPTTSTTLSNSVAVTSDQTDQNPDNNNSTFSTQVSPADLSVSVSTQPESLDAGSPLTFTATVINNGPSKAPGVQYFQSLPANSRFVSINSSQGSLSYSNGQIIGSLGDLGTNGSATVTLVVVPLSGGSATSSASVSSGVIDTNSDNNLASAAATVTNRPGSIAFDSILYQAPENSGYAALTLTRTGGTQGSVSVVYTTLADGSAQAGVNFTPVSHVVTFADGEISKTVFVPVSADGTYESYTYLDVKLSDPTGGVSIGDPSITRLAIMNTDVDLLPLQVASTTLIASGSTINGVQVAFNKPLDPASAAALNNFFLIGPNGQGLLTFPPMYNPANNSVTIVPAAPLTSPGFYTLVINAAANGLHDYHGTVLDGNNDGLAGGNFVESFARGTSLAYADATGNFVNLSLSRGGLLEMFRDASGNAKSLNILPPASGRSTLYGSVQRVGPSATGSTNLGVVTGLSLPGPVRSGLTTPPFYVQSMVNSTTSFGVVRRPLRGQTRVAGVHLPRWFHRTV